RSTIVPMTDDRVATLVETPSGTLAFQDYFVARRQADEVTGVRLTGADTARPAPGVLEAIARAEAIVFCPSNPFVSIGPILAVPGVAAAIAASPAPVVAISPIVGGQAIKGPAAKMFASLGFEPSALAVARHYLGQIDGLVIDEVDAALGPEIAAHGIRPLVTRSVMGGLDDRMRLAAETVAFAHDWAPVGSGA
ncbi:MAG TPA: 2-phospho-L-lactate transferase CofD family protein, partial [Thermomicrobiales bacterium]|nr:2-phospho-L-lactate transferase CofD family protein [Thermomicrobiales bacterium]